MVAARMKQLTTQNLLSNRYEGLYTLIVSPRAEAGKYFLKDGLKGDVNEPWGRHFNGKLMVTTPHPLSHACTPF